MDPSEDQNLKDLLATDFDGEGFQTDAVFDQLQPRLAGGPRNVLQTQSTSVRITLAVGLLAVIGLGSAVGQGLRHDLDGAGQLTLFAIAAGMWAMGVSGVVAALRGHHEPPVSWVVAPVIGVLGLVAALFPWPGMALPTMAFWPWTTACVLAGALTTALAVIGVLLFDRDDVPTTQRSLLAVTGVAVASFAFQNLHCPFNDVAHLLAGHASYALLVAPLLLWVNRLRR